MTKALCGRKYIYNCSDEGRHMKKLGVDVREVKSDFICSQAAAD